MGNEKKWSIGQDAKKGDILVAENSQTKWIFRFDGGCEYIGHYAYRDMLIETKLKPKILDEGEGVLLIEYEENVRPANDDEKELFFQSFDDGLEGQVDISKLEEFRDWLKEQESYVDGHSTGLGRAYAEAYADGIKTAREKLERMFNL